MRDRPMKGPLRINPRNPRYFADDDGIVYLTGSHNWSNFQLFEDDDFGTDKWYEDYLDFLNKFNHNFTRLWMWECGYGAEWMLGWREDKKHVSPLPFKRIADGWFDLMSFNEEFFEILRKRVVKAKEHGIYVSVMLFQGWDVERKGRVVNPFDAHPFNRKNNMNGIDGDPHNLNEGIYVHTLENPSITGIQESYVRKVIETLNDLDNVLYEVSNESCRKSTEWQYHMINFIHEYEEGQMEKRHPVGMTFTWSDKWIGSNADLFNSPAEWISPNPEAWSGYDYRYNPPPADGRKIVILDTDHLWGIGGDSTWVWRAFLRGYNPAFMDPYDSGYSDIGLGLKDIGVVDPRWELIRKAMGYTRMFAERLGLLDIEPHPELARFGYCLANPGSKYLVYISPECPSRIWVDLSTASGIFHVEWFDPNTGEKTEDSVLGGARRSFSSPFPKDALLLIER